MSAALWPGTSPAWLGYLRVLSSSVTSPTSLSSTSISIEIFIVQCLLELRKIFPDNGLGNRGT
jgi:hypothetical protein